MIKGVEKRKKNLGDKHHLHKRLRLCQNPVNVLMKALKRVAETSSLVFQKKSFAGCIVIVVKYSVETPSVNDMSLKKYKRSRTLDRIGVKKIPK